ncbi:MAG: LysR substrate-binding domain-containing protein [Pseudomonadota bacterium]
MATLVSLAKSGDVKIAASEMALTPSAIYKFVRELEAQLDLALFERRTGGRLRPTEFCEYLLSNISLIFAELRYALEDLQSLDGQIVGSVTIGTLPSTRSIIVPAALDKFIARYPNISVSTREASHRQMTSALAAGDLDMIITGTRPLSPQPGVTTTHLCDDTLHLVARSDHALFKRRKVRVEHLNDSRWVLPPKTTPARHVYEAIMKETGLSSDMACVESNSVVIMRSMVLNSDFIAITSAQQTQIERNAGAIAIVPFELSDDAWPIGVLTRNNTELSPAATAFFKMLKEAADELPN